MRRPSQTVGEMTCRVASTPVMDARVARTHAAVMQAATDLLVEGGPNAMTVDAVVARSGHLLADPFHNGRGRRGTAEPA